MLEPSKNERPQQPEDNKTPDQGPQTPQSRELNRLDQHAPQVLTFSGLSHDSITSLLQSLMPEIGAPLREELLGAILERRELDGACVLESYFNETPLSIHQTRTIHIGEGASEEGGYEILILRHSDDEPHAIDLRHSHQHPGSIDCHILLSFSDHKLRWDLVDSAGTFLGRDDLSALFEKATPEQIQDNGKLRITLLTPTISISTLPPSISEAAEALSPQPPDLLGAPRAWLPTSIQCSDTGYSEQHAVIERLAPEQITGLVESGLLNTADFFVGHHSTLKPRNLERAARKLPFQVTVEFKRSIELADDAEEEEEDDVSGEHAGSDDISDESHPEVDSTLSETVEEGSTSDPRVQSSVIISGLISPLGECSISYRSWREELALMGVSKSDSVGEDLCTFGIDFHPQSEPLRPQEVALRWKFLRDVGRIINSPISKREVRSLFQDFAGDVDAIEYGVDLTTQRLLAHFRRSR